MKIKLKYKLIDDNKIYEYKLKPPAPQSVAAPSSPQLYEE